MLFFRKLLNNCHIFLCSNKLSKNDPMRLSDRTQNPAVTRYSDTWWGGGGGGGVVSGQS